MSFAVKDVLQKVTKALPNGAAATTSDAIDLGHGFHRIHETIRVIREIRGQVFCFALRLKDELQPKLHRSCVLRCQDPSGVCISQDGVGIGQVYTVGHVEHLPAQLDVLSLRYEEVLR